MKFYKSFCAIKAAAIAVILITIVSCSATKTATPAEYAALTQKLESGNLRIAIDAAYPSNTYATQQVINSVMRGTGDTANRIDLSGDGHFMELGVQRVAASLPFYGERRQGGGYNNPQDSGIVYDVAPKEYTVNAQPDSYKYEVSFEADAASGIDTFDVETILFANGNAVIYVRSNTRTRIEYRGKIVEALKQ
jgi:hypothetical protein